MDDKLRELLDADVSKIAEEGKKSNRSKLQKIIVVTVLAVVIGIAVHIGLKESAYRKALTLADEGNYTEAMTAFENLKGYRSSKENAENVTHANNFMKSAVSHAQSEQLSKELSSYKTVFPDINFDTSFDWRTETFIIRVSSDNFSKSDMEVTDELTSAILPSFIALCHDIDRSSQSIQTACKVSGGYSVDCSIECIGTDGELLYSSQNGEEKTSCIDIAATEDKLYGPSYQKMVDAVDAKEYAKCYETWDVLNADGYYDLSYKDISDYYYYARAMSAYTSSEAVSLSQLQSDLNNVSGDFKDAKDMRTKIAEIAESAKTALNGTYHKDSCELEIGSESLSWKIVSGSEKGNSLSAKIDDYLITDGKVTQVHAVREKSSDEQAGVTIAKANNGVKVALDDSVGETKYGGMFLPGAVPSRKVSTPTNENTSTNTGLSSSAIQGIWQSAVSANNTQKILIFNNGAFRRKHCNYNMDAQEYARHGNSYNESVDVGEYYISGNTIIVTYKNWPIPWQYGDGPEYQTEKWSVSQVSSGIIQFKNSVGGYYNYTFQSPC